MMQPIRDGECFGDIFQGLELDPDLSPILVDNPTLDGFARLCNVDEECDELTVTLEWSESIGSAPTGAGSDGL